MFPAVGSVAGRARAARWCPTREQVTLLEELYKGGLTNPTAGQIHQIVAHLSRFGKVQGKNVFYWFQNHKARDKERVRKKLMEREKHTAELRMRRRSNSPGRCTAQYFFCKTELGLQCCNSSSSVSPFHNDEMLKRKMSTMAGDSSNHVMVDTRGCCGGVIMATLDGGCGGRGGLTWPRPQPRYDNNHRIPTLATLDLFPVTPPLKQREASNQLLSSNYSRAGGARSLLPNPNLSLGLPTNLSKTELQL